MQTQCKKPSEATHANKLLRLFSKLMLQGKRHYQSDLAEHLECSPQTVSRLAAEIESFVGSHLEIGTEKRRRYYQLKSYSGRRTLGLDFEELRYLSICHDLASPHLPKPVSDRVENTLFALSTLMADPDFERREEVQQRPIGFKAKGHIDYSPHFSTIEKLIEAANKRRVCLVDYKAGARKPSKTYYYAPGRIVSMSGALYVRGHQVSKGCADKERATTFAVHRIQDVTTTDKRFSFDASIDDKGSFGLKWHEPKKFQIHFKAEAADYVRERIWSEDQCIEELADGEIVLKLSAVSEKELLAWVWSFGNLAQIKRHRVEE